MIGACVFDVCYTAVPFSQGPSNQRPLLFTMSLQPKASPFYKATLLLFLQILCHIHDWENFFYIIFEILHTFCTAQSKLIIQKCIKVPYKYV